MRKFVLTSASFTGHVLYEFDSNGRISCLNLEAELNDQQHQYIWQNIPKEVAQVAKLNAIAKLKITEVQIVVTFDMFWNKYNDKIRSSKKKTLAIWLKMDEGNHLRSFLFIDTYNLNRVNAEKKYAETYLHAQLWNN
jgi:adenylate kinase family enzyme